MADDAQLEQAIAHLEGQRAVLGDAVVDAALKSLREKLSTQDKHQSNEERKLVTVMFADISGFTALSEEMDPEEVRELINHCFDCLVPCLKRYDGTIDKFIGDEIMALFGAPLAHENDPERALRAALEMQSALEKFNIENKTQLGIHFGINTGLVLAGGIGSSGQQEYSVVGDAVNLAARLQDISERGQILVGADTHRMTSSVFDFETMNPVTVKGKSELVAVYRLIAAKAGVISSRGLKYKGISSPLVGRTKECQIIKHCLETLSLGQGGVVAIIGEAGLGKSRLMTELRNDAKDIQWLEGKTLSFGQSISYLPFQEIVRAYAEIDEDDSAMEAWQKLERKIVAFFPESAIEILPYLAIMMTMEVQEAYVERVKYLDGDALGKRIFLAMRRFVERLARIQPLAMVFEDMHWMDASSVELLEHLLTLTREVPLLVIGVSRPDPNTASARLQEFCASTYAEIYTEINLTPLSPNESIQLVDNLLAIDDLPAGVREAMTQKAEGNPFFIEEIIRNLLDMRTIVHDPGTGRWRATAHVVSVQIPDTVQGVIMARIDRLDEDVKQALCMAAVIGRSFLYRILRHVDAADNELDMHLAQLQQVELILEKQAVPELEYIFKHALAQEATYESILIQKRRDLHGRVAKAIESLFAERLDEFYSLLSYHYARAENWTKAQEYLFKSGDQAGNMAADAEALTHYQKAMDAYTKAFGDKWNPVQRAHLERKMGEAFYRRGEHQQAEEYFRKALADLGRPLPTIKWDVRFAILLEFLQQVINRLFTPDLEKRTAQNSSESIDDEFAIYVQLGLAHAFTDLEKTLLDVVRGLNRAEAVGAVDEVVMGLAGLGYACTNLNLDRLAGMYLDEALKLSRHSVSAQSRALAHYLSGFYFISRGQMDRADETFRITSQIYRDTGNLIELAMSEGHLKNIMFFRGNFHAARAICRQNLNMAKEMQNINIECYFLPGMAKCSSILGDEENVVEQLQRSIELSKEIPNYLQYVESLGYLARHYLRTENLEQALACLENATTAIAKYKTYGYFNMQTYNAYAEACLIKAEGINAEKSLWMQKAYYWITKGLKQGQYSRTDLTEAQRFRGRFEWLKGNQAAARRWWVRSLNEAQKMGLRYFGALTLLEMGNYLGDIECLQRAEITFEKIDALPDLERVRRMKERIKHL